VHGIGKESQELVFTITPSAVIAQVEDLLKKGGKVLLCRDEFESSSWKNVVLVINLGNFEDVMLTTPVRDVAPSRYSRLGGSQLVSQLPCVDQVLVYESSGFTSSNVEREIELFRSAFDAA